MRKEDQVISLLQAQYLQKLGIVQHSCMMAYVRNSCRPETVYRLRFVNSQGISYGGFAEPGNCLEGFAAFTVAELGQMLPEGFYSMPAVAGSGSKGYTQVLPRKGFYFKVQRHWAAATEIYVRYLQLMDVIGQKVLTIDEINQTYLQRIGAIIHG